MIVDYSKHAFAHCFIVLDRETGRQWSEVYGVKSLYYADDEKGIIRHRTNEWDHEAGARESVELAADIRVEVKSEFKGDAIFYGHLLGLMELGSAADPREADGEGAQVGDLQYSFGADQTKADGDRTAYTRVMVRGRDRTEPAILSLTNGDLTPGWTAEDEAGWA
jgi:hypothetical protein